MAVTLSEDKLPHLRDRLKGKPQYMKPYLELVARLESSFMGVDFIVDRWPEVTAVVAKSNAQCLEPRLRPYKGLCDIYHCMYQFLSTACAVGGDDETAVQELLDQPGVIDWKNEILFTSVDCTLSHVVINLTQSHCGKTFSDDVTSILYATTDSLQLSPVPDGYRLSSLTLGDADLVKTSWKYSCESTLDYIKKMISLFPSVCLHNSDGSVIGFALTYHFGFLGMLHVMERYRGQGHGKVIMSQLAQMTIGLGREAAVIIEENNTISVNLHEKIGFKKMPDFQAVWIHYTPKGCCSSGSKACCI